LLGKKLLKTALFLGVVLLAASGLQAGTGGKIAGVVRSAESGAPLAGATVTIIGHDIATSTDLDGEFYLINLPVGDYDVMISLIGFQKEVRSHVKVLLDLTTPIEFELVSVPVELDQVVTVRAERPLIQKDLTASVETFTKEVLAVMPRSRSIDDILLNMTGTVSDQRGELHVRGGRDGQVTYYLDGMPVQDQFHGFLGTRITPEALEEINLATGGFSAEYGEALSGVVNALTQEGSNRYAGRIKLADGMTRSYSVYDGEYGSHSRTDNYYGVFNFSGPLPLLIPEDGNFFTSFEYRHDGGYLPHNRLESWSNTSKLTVKPWDNFKLIFSGNYYFAERQRYDHRDVNGYSYDFALENSGLINSESYRLSGKSTFNLSPNTMLTFKAGYFETWTKLAPDHLFDVYWDQWPGYSEDENGLYNGTIQDNYFADSTYYYTGFINDTLFYPYYLYRKSSYETIGLDFLSQINKYNQVLIGGEFRQNQLNWDNKQFFNVRPYGEQYDVGPSYAAAYLQDKIELGFMVVNAGLRLDYLNAEVDYWDDPVAKNQLLRSKSKTHISPRLGFSHPVSDHTVFHFNYGYYYQVPNYPYMFTNLQADLTTGYPLIGNPDLEPEKTVAYEFGVNHSLEDNVRLSATTYYKDISDLISTREGVYPGGTYYQYVNGDWGSVKGLDLSITKMPRGRLSGTLNYSYMIAQGNSSDANEFYYDYFTEGDEAPVLPVTEFPLAFDQRHTLSLNIDYRVGRGDNPRLFGLTLPSAWGANLLFSYGSGMPYTKTDDDGNRVGALNEGRMPVTHRVDLRLDKDFFLSKAGDRRLRLFLEVNNIFDRRNVVNVYNRTGQPDDFGYHYELTLDPEGPATAEDVNNLQRLMAHDPQNYDAPRSIHWGLELMFYMKTQRRNSKS
jgi:outer membrane receptor protein involved in Fe transport